MRLATVKLIKESQAGIFESGTKKDGKRDGMLPILPII